MASDVSDVCLKLQGVQLQLSLVLTRNEEVLKHLTEVENIVLQDGSSIDKELFQENIKKSRAISKKLEETINIQNQSVTETVKELEQRTADTDQRSGRTTPNKERRRSSLSEQQSSLEFQLKAQLDHNVQLHEEKAELETRLKEHMETLKESGRQADRLEEELVETKKQIKGLLDLFENKAASAEKRIVELQTAMDSTKDRAKQYQDMYEVEKENSYRREKEQRERMIQAKENGDDEEDGLGPVLISRPQTSVKRVKSAPIDPHIVDPQYVTVLEENKKLRIELERVRTDNAHLVKKSKQAQRDIETIQNHVATCSGQREDLRRRLKKEQDENRKLSNSMTRQASDWVMQKKMVKDIDHYNKVGKIQPEATLSAVPRYRSHPIKPNEDKPRNIPVESWSTENPLRAV